MGARRPSGESMPRRMRWMTWVCVVNGGRIGREPLHSQKHLLQRMACRGGVCPWMSPSGSSTANNFYVSCERVFRPDPEGKPVISRSHNDGNAISHLNESGALGGKRESPLSKSRTSSSVNGSPSRRPMTRFTATQVAVWIRLFNRYLRG